MAASAAGVRSVTSTHASPPRTSASASGAADATESITTTGTSRTVPRSVEVLNAALRRRRCRPASDRLGRRAPVAHRRAKGAGPARGRRCGRRARWAGDPRETPAGRAARPSPARGSLRRRERARRIREGDGRVLDGKGAGARTSHAGHPRGEDLRASRCGRAGREARPDRRHDPHGQLLRAVGGDLGGGVAERPVARSGPALAPHRPTGPSRAERQASVALRWRASPSSRRTAPGRRPRRPPSW